MSEYHKVTTLSELPIGGKKLIQLQGRAIAVFNVDGEFFDYSYRYTPKEGNTEYGKQVAITDALKDYDKEIIRL